MKEEENIEKKMMKFPERISFFGPSESGLSVHFGQAHIKAHNRLWWLCARIYEGNPDGRVVTKHAVGPPWTKGPRKSQAPSTSQKCLDVRLPRPPQRRSLARD